MTEPAEGERYRDSADERWEVVNPHHQSESGRGIVFENVTSGMTMRLSMESFRSRIDTGHLVAVEREGAQ